MLLDLESSGMAVGASHFAPASFDCEAVVDGRDGISEEDACAG